MTSLSPILSVAPSAAANESGLPAAGLPVLAIEDLGKAYGAITVLSGVGMDIHAGEIHAIIGENGAGKSTLMKLLSGHVQPTTGQIVLEGAPVSFTDAVSAERAGIVLVHQEILLANDLTVAENLFLGRETGPWWTVNDRAMNQRSREVLGRIGSTARPRDLVRDLPLAQRQLVQIARALLDDRKVIIFDEPSAVLANDEVAALLAVVRQLRDAGAAVLYISHRLDEVEALADRITVLRDGQMIGTWPAEGISQRQMAELMVGRKLEMLYPNKRDDIAREPVLEVRGLNVGHGAQQASFTIKSGEVLGIGGMIGSGRTELIEGLMGLRPSHAEAISLRGEPVNRRSVNDWKARGVVYLTEDRKGKGLLLDDELAPNLTLTALSEVHPRVMLRPARETRALRGAVSDYDIRVRSIRLTAGQLSGGNQQKLLLAKVMLTDPSVVIIDEPTRGIDIGNKSQIYEFIDSLVRGGKACVVISSELSELVGIADRILVMRGGRIAAEMTGDEITEQNVVYAATSSHHTPPGGRDE